jgi:hypothetical protein
LLTDARKASSFGIGGWSKARDFLEGSLSTFFDLEPMPDMLYCWQLVNQAQVGYALAFSEITDGANMRTILTGVYRSFMGIQDLLYSVRCVTMADDFGVFALFASQIMRLGGDYLTLFAALGETYKDTSDLWV